LVGITDGRATFINTLKYISIATSANFGNMISMALASVFLPFLPLLAKQILLNNFLSDIPAMAIATDTVDPGAVDQPQHWSIGYIRRFMVCFGLISSIFDMVTFGFLLWVAKATESHFQTGWFVESLVTQLATLLVVRTRLPAWKSRPSPWLAGLVASLAAVAAMLPFTPVGAWFGLVPIPPLVLLGLGVITLLYLLSAEAAKRWFFKHEHDRKTGKLALTHPSPGMRHHEA
jgi:Mg2+-importing ATPase